LTDVSIQGSMNWNEYGIRNIDIQDNPSLLTFATGVSAGIFSVLVQNNTALTSLDFHNSPKTQNDFKISHNPQLATLNLYNFQNVQSGSFILEDIIGTLDLNAVAPNLYGISNDFVLKDVPGISNFPSTIQPGGIKIINTGFVDLDMTAISSFSYDVVIQNNLQLVSIEGNAPAIYGGLYLNNNPLLTAAATQFPNLNYIGTVNNGNSIGDLDISGSQYTSLNMFSSLTGVSAAIRIHDNAFLHDVDGLPSVGMDQLIIFNNSALVSLSGLCGITIRVSASVSGDRLCCDAVNRILTPALQEGATLAEPICVVGPSIASRDPAWADCGDDNYFTCLCPSFNGPECGIDQFCRDDSVTYQCAAGACHCSLDAVLSSIDLIAPGLVKKYY